MNNITLNVNVSELNDEQRHGLILLLGMGDMLRCAQYRKYSDSEIDDMLSRMYKAGLEMKSEFQIDDIWARCFPDKDWDNLDPSFRKTLGKRFKKLVQETACNMTPFLQDAGRNIQGGSLYTVSTITQE